MFQNIEFSNGLFFTLDLPKTTIKRLIDSASPFETVFRTNRPISSFLLVLSLGLYHDIEAIML